jgi:hypothetical protein
VTTVPYQVASTHLQLEAWEINAAEFEDSMACNFHRSGDYHLSLLAM